MFLKAFRLCFFADDVILLVLSNIGLQQWTKRQDMMGWDYLHRYLAVLEASQAYVAYACEASQTSRS